MSALARSVSASRGRLLVRVEAIHGGTIDGVSSARTIDYGTVKHRALTQDEAVDADALCRAFGFDPARVRFDLPSSARGTGSNMSGAGGSGRGSREISGFVFDRAKADPIAKVIFLREGTAFRDVDPTDRTEFERL